MSLSKPRRCARNGFQSACLEANLREVGKPTKILLRPKQVTKRLAVRPRFESTPVEQAVKQFACTFKRNVPMPPFRERQRRQILVACFMLLEGDLVASSTLRRIVMKEPSSSSISRKKTKSLNKSKCLKRKNLGSLPARNPKSKDAPAWSSQDCGCPCFDSPAVGFSHDDIQPRSKVHGLEHIRLVGIEFR